jgi:hypothetical protein
VTGALRLIARTALRDRGVLAPALALLTVIAGVFAYRPNDVAGTWALTALLAFPLTAWLRVAVGRAEPDAQRLIRVAAAGATARLRIELVLAAALATIVVLPLLAWPLITDAFDRPVTAAELVAAALTHAACAATGAALGRLSAPPTVARAATALTLILAATVATVALTGAFSALTGPGAASDALAGSRPGAFASALVAPLLTCALWSVALAALTRALDRRSG